MNISSMGGSGGLQAMQQALFKTLDADQDGALSSTEFQAIGQALPGDGQKGAHKAQGAASQGFGTETLQAMLSAQEDRFAASDADGDGQLSIEEFQAAAPKGPPPGQGPGGPPPTQAANDADGADAAKAANPADANGDGSVSGAELLAYLQGAATSASSALSTDASSLMQDLLAQLSKYGQQTDGATAKVA